VFGVRALEEIPKKPVTICGKEVTLKVGTNGGVMVVVVVESW